MTRVRSNIETLVAELPTLGWDFGQPGTVRHAAPLALPEPDVRDSLDALEARVGPLPLSLRAWYEVVGDVNLCGMNPAWNFGFPDPLVVEAPVDYVLSQYDAWEEDRGTEWDSGPFTIDFAPDDLHKANVSGGSYAHSLHDAGADGAVLWERHQTTFVPYLRVCFRWAGMPGWDGGQVHAWARPTTPFPVGLCDLARKMLPL